MILYTKGEEKAKTIVGKTPEHRPHKPSPYIPALEGEALRRSQVMGRDLRGAPLQAGFAKKWGFLTVASCSSLILHGPITDLQTLINNREGFAQLFLVNAQRRIGIERIPAHQRVESLLAEELPQRCHLV